jgi:hypothetical protein
MSIRRPREGDMDPSRLRRGLKFSDNAVCKPKLKLQNTSRSGTDSKIDINKRSKSKVEEKHENVHKTKAKIILLIQGKGMTNSFLLLSLVFKFIRLGLNQFEP